MLLPQVVVVGDGDNVGTFTGEQVFLKEAHGNYEGDFSE